MPLTASGEDLQRAPVGVAGGEAGRRGDEARRVAQGFAKGVGLGRAAVHQDEHPPLAQQGGHILADGGEIHAFSAAYLDDND